MLSIIVAREVTASDTSWSGERDFEVFSAFLFLLMLTKDLRIISPNQNIPKPIC